MDIGIIGSGRIGSSLLARHLAALAAETGATASTVEQAASRRATGASTQSTRASRTANGLRRCSAAPWSRRSTTFWPRAWIRAGRQRALQAASAFQWPATSQPPSRWCCALVWRFHTGFAFIVVRPPSGIAASYGRVTRTSPGGADHKSRRMRDGAAAMAIRRAIEDAHTIGADVTRRRSLPATPFPTRSARTAGCESPRSRGRRRTRPDSAWMESES
jgi:hypothetical protein